MGSVLSIAFGAGVLFLRLKAIWNLKVDVFFQIESVYINKEDEISPSSKVRIIFIGKKCVKSIINTNQCPLILDCLPPNNTTILCVVLTFMVTNEYLIKLICV